MQPKRDPNDRRFWPVRLGGTAGFGKQRYGQPSPYRYGSLSPEGTLGTRPRSSRTYAQTVIKDAKHIDAEAVRAKARIVTLRLLDRLEDAAKSMEDKQLPDALKAAGALAIERTATVNVSHRMLSGEERAQRVADLLARASARLLIEGAGATEGATPADAVDAEIVDTQGDSGE